MKQGTRANQLGRAFEDMIASVLTGTKYIEATKQEKYALKNEGIKAVTTPIYAQNTCVEGFNTLYGKPWKLDLFMYDPVILKKGLALEAKFQQTGGSVDHKYPYVVLSLNEIKNKNGAVVAFLNDSYAASEASRKWAEKACNDYGIAYLDSTSKFAGWLRVTTERTT